MECPICFENNLMDTGKCNHSVCVSCLSEIAKEEIIRCPLCRIDWSEFSNYKKDYFNIKYPFGYIYMTLTDLIPVIMSQEITEDNLQSVIDRETRSFVSDLPYDDKLYLIREYGLNRAYQLFNISFDLENHFSYCILRSILTNDFHEFNIKNRGIIFLYDY